MKKQYPYLNDTKFLSKIDSLRVKEQWVKITLLEYNSEVPLKDIEGEIVSGTLTKVGDSSVRRTCNLTCAVDSFKYNPDDIKADYSISKKIYLELGITNTTDDYLDENIIWFPQGVFFITSFTISTSAGSMININLQFKDKMAQLDGTVGGTLPATVRFDTVTTVVNDTVVTSKELIYNIIMEAVHHFGGESLSNIIIDDIPTKAKRIIRWKGSESVWIYPLLGKDNQISYDICFASDLDEKQSAHTPIIHNGKVIAAKEYKPNQDIGYMYEDFVYDDELTFKAGAKVTDVLNKIKDWLGNYEYFYDEQGQFHFQEIKNYLKNPQSAYIWNKLVETNDLDYLHESSLGKATYVFDDNTNLVSITNTPVYENIKNDFIVEGTVTRNNVKSVCRYHLVIDDKPTITPEGYNNILMYTDPLTKNTTITKPEIIDPTYNVSEQKYVWALPEFAEGDKIYGLLDEPQTLTFKKQLREMEEFADYYNNLVNEENLLIIEDNNYILTPEMKKYLFALLENYMGYIDQSSYKTEYYDMVCTLARQLRRYNVDKQASSLPTTIEYYESLYSQYLLDIGNYGEAIADKISWCGELLQMLYDLFSDINSSHRPSNKYKDSSFWPAINMTVPDLWNNISLSNDETILKNKRKARCIQYINALKIKQKQLEILIKSYTKIINNYNLQIALDTTEQNSENNLVENKNSVQNQINLFKEEQEICDKRLTLLYAILTALGSPDSEIGETYFYTDIDIDAYVTSFWYYDVDNNSDTYGWNELEWYQYYLKYEEDSLKEYYPYGLGSMTYINYSTFNWENFNNEYKPSMNRHSPWYKNYYINYAIEKNLPYFDNSNNNFGSYIPTNWRTELLLRGMQAEENGTDPGYYYQELKANWPTVYDFKTEQLIPSSISNIDYFVGNTGVILGNEYQFITEDVNSFEANNTDKAKFKDKEAEIQDFLLNYENGNYYYFFDMIDSSSSVWGEYSVNNIGRRLNVNTSESVNCIFEPHIPDYAFINVSNLTMEERRKTFLELEGIAEDIIQVTNTFQDNFITGGFKQSAYEQIKYDLKQYTSYQNTVSITAIPCFYLEPNILVRLNDNSTNTFGSYIIKSISIPLGAGNNMSVNMSRTQNDLVDLDVQNYRDDFSGYLIDYLNNYIITNDNNKIMTK